MQSALLTTPHPVPPTMRYSAEELGLIRAAKLTAWLRTEGIDKRDPRIKANLQQLLAAMSDAESQSADRVETPCVTKFSKATVERIFSSTGSVFLLKVLRNELIVRDFSGFAKTIERLFEQARQECTVGEVSRLTPELAESDPDLWGMSLCTVDGQRLSLGDSRAAFCLQDCSQPITYAVALTEKGPDVVHQYVGYEPVGEHHEGLEIGPDGKPFNPLTGSGALLTAALIGSPQDPLSCRFSALRRIYSRLLAGGSVAVHTGAYLSQREANYHNWAVAYRLLELGAFPPGANVADAMDLHLQLGAFSIDCQAGALIAAALANGGVCPLTEDRVLSPAASRSTLSVMHSCGLGRHSGRFAFKCGLPATAGVSGCVVAVLPNVMGLCLYSPRLLQGRVSARALRFCELLVQVYSFHLYDSLLHNRKLDPTSRLSDGGRARLGAVSTMLYAAKDGDIACLRRFYLTGHDMNSCDYDSRTPLHVAASEGRLAAVQFLCGVCMADRRLRDRWGFTARDCARLLGRDEVESFLAQLDDEENKAAVRTGAASESELIDSLETQLREEKLCDAASENVSKSCEGVNSGSCRRINGCTEIGSISPGCCENGFDEGATSEMNGNLVIFNRDRLGNRLDGNAARSLIKVNFINSSTDDSFDETKEHFDCRFTNSAVGGLWREPRDKGNREVDGVYHGLVPIDSDVNVETHCSAKECLSANWNFANDRQDRRGSWAGMDKEHRNSCHWSGDNQCDGYRRGEGSGCRCNRDGDYKHGKRCDADACLRHDSNGETDAEDKVDLPDDRGEAETTAIGHLACGGCRWWLP